MSASEPVSDERLAEIETRFKRGELRLSWIDAGDLIAEVRRLRAEVDLLTKDRDAALADAANADAWIEQFRNDCDETEAALARVTDDSMAAHLATIPLTWTKRMSDGHLSTGYRDAQEVAADVLEMIRAVAAGEEEPRPDHCCGVCPPVAGGGYDCTCKDNPRCEKS